MEIIQISLLQFSKYLLNVVIWDLDQQAWGQWRWDRGSCAFCCLWWPSMDTIVPSLYMIVLSPKLRLMKQVPLFSFRRSSLIHALENIIYITKCEVCKLSMDSQNQFITICHIVLWFTPSYLICSVDENIQGAWFNKWWDQSNLKRTK